MAQRQFRTDDTSGWSDRFGYGSDGAYAPSTGTDAPTDSACTGTSGTTSLTATNASFATGQLLLIHQTQGTGAGQWELNKIASYTAGTITTAYSLINTYATGAQVLVMPQYSSGNIAGGVTLTGKAWNGTVGGIYAKFCSGTFTVAGALTVKEKGFRGGGADTQGEGQSGVGANSHTSTSYNGVGGGGCQAANNENGGGGAGHAAAGSAGTSDQSPSDAGVGGSTGGVAALTTMIFGGGGGGSHGRAGAKGGGLVLIISKIITITGSIAITGGTNSSVSATGNGGSAAGGSGLLKAQILTLGSNLLTSAGGVTSPHTGFGGNGGAGSVGRIHADYSATISGTTTPTIDSSQDSIYTDRGGSFLFGMI